MGLVKTDSWTKYETGINFFRKTKYFSKVAKAERFYANQHWHGMEAVDLPKPVFPMSKRIVDFKVSSVMAEEIKLNYTVQGYTKGSESDKGSLYDRAADTFTRYSETTWDEVKQKALNEEMLLNAALSGPGILHYYMDKETTGNDVEAIGSICGEVIDGVNLFLGNPNDKRINANGKPIQPYIIISYRELVSKAKEDAKANGVPQLQIDLITADSDTHDQAFDMAQYELDDQSTLIALLHYYQNPKTKTIWMKKSAKNVDIVKDIDTGRKLYPVAMMNWDLRKRFSHGMGEMEGQIPNQIAVNTLFAMAILSAQRTGVPKAIYDKTRISGWSNAIGKAIGVDGDITNVFKYAETGNVSFDFFKIIDSIITYTKELAGASENALGDAKADNTSALMWAQKQSAIPLESVKRRFMTCMHDVGLIWAEMWQVNFDTTRSIVVKDDEGQDQTQSFNGSDYKGVRMNLKVDVGPSSSFSEITNLNMLNMWLDKDRVTFVEYLERLPNGTVPRKEQLIETRKQQEQMQAQQQQQMAQDQAQQGQIQQDQQAQQDQAQQQDVQMQQQSQDQQFEKMAKFMESLPLEVQQKIHQLSPQQMEQTLMKMMQDDVKQSMPNPQQIMKG